MGRAFTITESRIYEYRLTCVPALALGPVTLGERRGFILRLIDHEGFEGLGEVAPLPGFSRESAAQALDQLQHCCRALASVALDHGWCRWQGEYEAFYRERVLPRIGTSDIFPSVRMGLELAVCELFSRRQGVRLAHRLNPAAGDDQVVCPLLAGGNDWIIRKANALKALNPVSQVKLKVGRQAPADDARLLRALVAIFGEDIRFRLDANRRWSSAQALRFAWLAPREHILYIEEPIADLAASRRFCEATGLGLALDETLHDPAFQLEPFAELAALVVKPTLCGGLEKTLALSRRGASRRLPVVISSSYESSLGIGQLAELAAALAPAQPAGLDTLDSYAWDLIRPADSRPEREPKPVLPLERLVLVGRQP